MSKKDVLSCAFCGKPQQLVTKLVAGPNVNICDACIQACQLIIAEDKASDGLTSTKEVKIDIDQKNLPKPKEIHQFLNDYIIGQEKSKRAGTTNVAGIAGFGEACKIAKTKPQKYKEVEKLRNYLEEEILKIAGKEVKIFAKEADRIPNTSYIALEYADSQAQVINFDVNGICVSGGSACSSGSAKASRVLKAMKVTPNFIDSAIRVSLSVDNTKEEVDKFIKVWSEFYERHKS